MDKREHIINTAVELFAEKGFEGTSVRDISAKAEVNVAMVNYYFGSKEKLLEALIHQKAAKTRELLEEIVNDNSKNDIEKVDAIIENYVIRILTQPAYHRIIHRELMLDQREELRNAIGDVFGKNKAIMKSIIENGIKNGSFQKVDPELTIASLIGSINQTLLLKSLCTVLLEEEEGFDPVTDTAFQKRLTTHIKQLMHSHLLKNNRPI